MDGGSSDILGGPTSPNARDTQSGRWSGLSFGVKSGFAAAALLVLYVIGIRTWETFLVWREKAYKLSMRRRHGIPDNDHRPFNVAYAAVVRARKESEDAARKAKLHELVQDQQNAPTNQNIRQRQGSAIQRNESMRLNPIPGRYDSYPTYQPSAEERYNPNLLVRIAEREVDSSLSGSSRRLSRKYINISDDEGRKSGFDGSESDESDHPKKSWMEGEELIDGEEEAEWYERQQVPQCGSKRVLGDDDGDDDAYPSTPSRDKRPRTYSLEKKPHYISEDMDIDEYDDEVADLRPTARGKKRDRAEAGSTFGGDDDDSAHEAEAEQDSRTSRRHRKRRTYAKRKSDVSTRGHKRGRNPEADDGHSGEEDDDGMTLKVSRKKRGKRSISVSEQDEESDVSMDHSQTSSRRGPIKTRRIGDEWENNGVKYKIGPNGQRLRQTLVKKARQKFNMPADSQHPDRQANLEVCIETWLTEEEYREAKDQLLLAWQDSNKPSAEPENQETPSHDSQELPIVAGKDLLWKSTSALTTPGTTTPQQITPPPGIPQLRQKDRELYSQSVAANVGLRINPFQTRLPGKRIASTARVSSAFSGAATTPASPASPSLTDSTNGSPRHKMFSKWEKQDLEAKAMRKMREANRKKEEMALKLKEEKEKAENARKALEAPKIVPAITVTKPEEAKLPAAAPKPGGFSFGPLPSTANAKTVAPGPGVGAPPVQQPKPADKPAAAPFSFAPAAVQSSKPAAFSLSSTSVGGQPLKPADNPFTAKKPEEPTKPPASFGIPAPVAPTFNPTSIATPPSATGGFSFGPAHSQPAQPSEKKPEAPAPAAGGSLFSRLAPATATPSQPTSQHLQTTSSFSFAKTPAAEAPKPTSAFGNLGAPQSAPQTPPLASTAPTPTAPTLTQLTAPKFSFGFGAKPASAAPASASASAPTPAVQPPSSSLSGALGNAESKPAPAPTGFGFKAPSAPGDQASPTTPAATPKFSFGAPQAPSTKSAFANSSAFAANPATSTTSSNPFGAKPATTTPSTTPAPATSAFGGFGGAGGSSSSTSAFPSASQPSTTSNFGSSNVFGGGGAANPFGASAKAPEAPQAAFSFGNTNTSAPAATAPANGKPLFSFGTPSSTPAPSTTAPAAGASPFGSGGFSFGDAEKTQAAQPAPGTSAFGKPSAGPSAFGFGATGATNGTTSVFGAFGKALSSTGQQQP
ncbi:hypothetical protein DXG03_000152 [Asterophora parasitica]|uniref:Uncharacterized protein n=1 Tax=Asterophora parasitica TaxID=117018 RepID=A0A9P7GEX7_9AGAR|nr:hypothetical protein DXG03_000152 [Asterophora parasitica]